MGMAGTAAGATAGTVGTVGIGVVDITAAGIEGMSIVNDGHPKVQFDFYLREPILLGNNPT
ncbi:MAG: hypothetical protein ABWY27_05580 [Telluria sp.]